MKAPVTDRVSIKRQMEPGLYIVEQAWGRELTVQEANVILNEAADAFETGGVKMAADVMKKWAGQESPDRKRIRELEDTLRAIAQVCHSPYSPEDNIESIKRWVERAFRKET